MNKNGEQVLLVSLLIGADSRHVNTELIASELRELSRTAGASVADSLFINVRKPNPSTLIGKGHIQQILSLCRSAKCRAVIFDHDLLPRQQANLEKRLSCKVIDRTTLILDIFAKQARTAEGKLQVERAQIDYLLPRLSQLWVQFSRLAGGIGTRGPGETQIESDRRELRKRISVLDKRLERVRSRRSITRKSRRKKGYPVVSLVGYTNAGKTSLMKTLTGQGPDASSALFATLDPLTRQLDIPNSQPLLLTDTVGFIQRLPTRLVASFRATLEEISESDLILHVVDGASHNCSLQTDTVVELLEDIGVSHLPTITVYNKSDLPRFVAVSKPSGALAISTKSGDGIQELKRELQSVVDSLGVDMTLRIPFEQAKLLSLIYRTGHVKSLSHGSTDSIVSARVPAELAARLGPYSDRP